MQYHSIPDRLSQQTVTTLPMTQYPCNFRYFIKAWSGFLFCVIITDPLDGFLFCFSYALRGLHTQISSHSPMELRCPYHAYLCVICCWSDTHQQEKGVIIEGAAVWNLRHLCNPLIQTSCEQSWQLQKEETEVKTLKGNKVCAVTEISGLSHLNFSALDLQTSALWHFLDCTCDFVLILSISFVSTQPRPIPAQFLLKTFKKNPQTVP